MIRVNLLPEKFSKRQEELRQQVLLAGIIAGMILLVMTGLQVTLSGKVDTLVKQNKKLSKEIRKLKTVVTELEEADEVKAELLRKLDVIQRLKANTTGPVHMLDELSKATPEKLQLTSLDQERSVVKLAGVAVSNEVISQFLSNLEKSAYFSDVYLNAIDQAESQGIKLKDFSITSRLVLPSLEANFEVEEPKEKKGKGKGKAKAKAKAKEEGG